MLKLIVKGIVTGQKSHPRNSRTGAELIIADERDFEKGKATFIINIKNIQIKGVAYFEGRNTQAFGQLTAQEWSNPFYKHIEHHFEQFNL